LATHAAPLHCSSDVESPLKYEDYSFFYNMHSAMNDLLLVFGAGLLGSMHCVGMCGGFILAISQTRDKTSALLHQGVYFLGKAITYAILGALVGLIGAALTTGFKGFQNGLSIFAGIVMVIIGLGLIGAFDRLGRLDRVGEWVPLKKALGYFLRDRSLSGSLGLGLLNGLLPCGLVYGILAKAGSTGSISMGALTMFVFGISTVPALLALGLTGHLLRPAWRARLNTAAGIVVIVLGLFTFIRGTPWRGDLMRVLGLSAQHAVEHVEESPPANQ
jgi:sulfite exporter TauE/SafE